MTDTVDTLQHSATLCNNTLQHTATLCNILQRTATLCNRHVEWHLYAGHEMMQDMTDTVEKLHSMYDLERFIRYVATNCNTLHHVATHCNTLQHTATHNTLHHAAPRCNIVQQTAQHLKC